MHDHQGFENFRRERNKRRMEGGPLRPLGQNAAILRELEAAEQREVRNQQLTREVHEFFADATRTAATIVSQVAETAEEQLKESVGREMSEFLTETMRRVQQFVELVRVSAPPGLAQKEMQANIQNIVGQTLDEFRFAGDVTTAEQHLGQDPFATELDLPPRSPAQDDDAYATADEAEDAAQPAAPQSSARPAHAPVQERPVTEIEDRDDDEPQAGDPVAAWFRRLADDDEALRNALRSLVRSNFMTKDEARAIYKSR